MPNSPELVSKPVSGAGPAREQPHFVLGPKGLSFRLKAEATWPCGANAGSPARVFCALGCKWGAPFAVTRDRVLKSVLAIILAFTTLAAEPVGE